MKSFVLAIGFALAAMPALAWGPEGHNVIANVAYDLLSPDLQAKFTAILQGGKGLTVTYTDQRLKEHSCGARTINQLANWPDCVRYGGSYATTYDAHFNDIPYCPKPPAAKRPASACRGKVCATQFLPKKIAELKAPGTAPFDRAAALAFVVHIVADMHQPLHMIDNHDRGGNDIRATLDGHATNLHRIWDGEVTEDAYPSTVEALSGTRNLAALHGADWSHAKPGQADFDAWASASHLIAVDAYNAVKPPVRCGATTAQDHLINADYVERFVPVVKEQLAKSAVRLSDVLRDALSAAP